MSGDPTRDARVRITLETLRRIEHAVVADSNSTIDGDNIIPGCPHGEECPPDILQFRVNNAVAIYCALLIAP